MLKVLKEWLNIKVIIGAILFALFVFGSLLGILWYAKAKTVSQAAPTALLRIIEAPTKTIPAVIATATSTPEQVPSQQLPTPGGEIVVGEYVMVTGTGGDGLRLHESAGVSTKVKYVAIDAEVFLVKDGPINMDGYVWWLLQDPYTENAGGWGVANYLATVQKP